MVSEWRTAAEASRLDADALVREDRLHGRIYTEPAIFALEIERIFERTWVYLAHESEIAQGGDYKATYVGLQPVIVARDLDDGAVRVLFNRCRHRAAIVCQQMYGNASGFRCAYHGWTYNSRGDLVGVPFRQGYGPDFDPQELGLVPVPRVASYRDFLFASLSPEGPSLEEHLGHARPYLDRVADQRPGGIAVRSGVQ